MRFDIPRPLSVYWSKEKDGTRMNYYISDYHMFHEPFVVWRGFSSVEEMNRAVRERWNRKIGPEDTVYLLGDFSQGGGRETAEYLRSLHGKKVILRGNHDEYLEDPEFDPECAEQIADYLELEDEGRSVVLSHYPIMCYNGQYREMSDPGHKTYMLYGHVHNSLDEVMIHEHVVRTRARIRKLHGLETQGPVPCNLINTFCRFSDLVPLSLSEWIELDDRRRAELKEEDYF